MKIFLVAVLLLSIVTAFLVWQYFKKQISKIEIYAAAQMVEQEYKKRIQDDLGSAIFLCVLMDNLNIPEKLQKELKATLCKYRTTPENRASWWYTQVERTAALEKTIQELEIAAKC